MGSKMNALTRSARLVLPRTKTFTSSQVRKESHLATKLPNACDTGNFTKNWLSDQGAYPVMAVVVLACSVCSARLAHSLLTVDDVRITPTARQTVIRPHRS